MPQNPQHKPVRDCVTRQGSMLGMMERLLEQQAAIAIVLVEGKTRYLMLDVAEWAIFKQLMDVLKAFHQATETMSAEKYSTEFLSNLFCIS